METYELSRAFTLGCLRVSPVHVRVEQLSPVIAEHAHSNTSYEIHYTVSGSGTVSINGERRRVAPDQLYITGPLIRHAQASDPLSPVLEHCLYLYCERAAGAADDPFSLFADTAFWMGKDNGRVAPLLDRLICENREKQPGWREMSETILREIIVVLTRMYGGGDAHAAPAPAVPPLTRAGLMPILEDAFFYRYRTLTLSELAGLVNLSVRQTQRLLQQNFGRTFSQKLSEARMAAGRQLLSGTSLSVTDIAEQLGFSSVEHFSSAFRRMEGMSPRSYRRLRRGAGSDG